MLYGNGTIRMWCSGTSNLPLGRSPPAFMSALAMVGSIADILVRLKCLMCIIRFVLSRFLMEKEGERVRASVTQISISSV